MKIVFMGTPDFAVPSLHALTEAGYAVAAVETQPDKPKGRGKPLLQTTLKEEADMHDNPVYQPIFWNKKKKKKEKTLNFWRF